MWQGIFRKIDFRTSGLHYLVVLGSFSRDYEVTREVRKEDELCLKFRIGGIGLGEQFRRTCLEFGHFFLGLFGFGLAAFFHESADEPRLLFLLCEDGVALRLERASFGIKLEHFLHDGPGVEIFYCKLRDHVFRIFTKRFKCQHNMNNK